MQQDGVRNSTFKGNDYTTRRLPYLEYEHCQFVDCNFSKADLSGISFSDCTFDGCNLGVANLDKTGLKNVHFKECKLIGLDFSVSNDMLFEVSFEGCNLDFAYFFRKKLKKAKFLRCSICEANFAEADLSLSVFEDCDLLKTIWGRTNLRGADFRSARRYAIDPEDNPIKGAKFSYPDVIGLLDKYAIEVE